MATEEELKRLNDDQMLQTHDADTKAKILDELNKKVQELTRENTEKQNLELQIRIQTQNTEEFNKRAKTLECEPDSGGGEEEEEEEQPPVCEDCGSDEHGSPCPRLTPT